MANARASDGPDAFARALARIACAQILYAQAERQAERARPAGGHSGVAASVGGLGANAISPARGAGTARGARPAAVAAAATELVPPSALHASEAVADALAEIAAAFIIHIGAASKARANLAGRRRAALTDVLSSLHRICPVTQSHTRDLARYAALEEIPFPSDVPQFPAPVSGASRAIAHQKFGQVTAASTAGVEAVPGTAAVISSSSKYDQAADGSSVLTAAKHDAASRSARPWIESWMPPLPPARTYIKTPGIVLAQEAKPDRALLSQQRRQVEISLAKLKQYQREGLVQASHALAQNPFLAPPQIGAAHISDEDVAGPSRDPPEPVNDCDVDALMSARGARDSNIPHKSGQSRPGQAPQDGRDPKRARVLRILAESAGTGGAGIGSSTVLSPSASPSPKALLSVKHKSQHTELSDKPASPLGFSA
jgi:hypothetical protein